MIKQIKDEPREEDQNEDSSRIWRMTCLWWELEHKAFAVAGNKWKSIVFIE